MPTPVTQYATTADGLSIAFQDLGGEGPAVVWVTGTASHVELFWEIPGWAHVIRRLSGFSRFIWFDKRGAGLSDRMVGSGLLEERMEDIRAVMDTCGVASATLIGSSESGAICALYAATFPDRVDRLVLAGTWAHNPTIADAAQVFADSWGKGWLLEMLWAQGMRDKDLLGRMERAMGTPSSMAALVRAAGRIDTRPVLPLITVPTLVIHCDRDPAVAVEHGREVASLVPDVTYVELEGTFHASARPEDMDLWGDACEAFIRGEDRPLSRAEVSERVLATVLFTDIVGSTERAAAVGDNRWTQLLDDHDRICRQAVERERGRVVSTTGDGLLATFDGPATAISAAQRMLDHLSVLGLQLRVGIHTGEVERRGTDIGGIGVNLAARVMAAAGDGEVWVSSTVPGLTVGIPIAFESRGRHALKGVPGEWELFAAKSLAGAR